ncbi:MAG: transglutaminase-like domain-containing protein [Oscillospiraceae bacterium]|nr:transglutaminase-like domain-containing protein [Oscillospiraceae bacterium]
MRETLRESERRRERTYLYSQSTATQQRRRRRRRRRNNGGTVLILLLFCALLVGGGIGTWKMATSAAAAPPEPSANTEPVNSSLPEDPEPPKPEVPVGAVSAEPVVSQPAENPATSPEPNVGLEPSIGTEPAEEPFEMDPLPEDLEEMVQKVLADIITPDMTEIEQAKAVWDFTKNGIRYTGDSDKSNWEAGAKEGLSTRKGDCFTYYAVSRAMLTSLGIPNIEVTRVGGISSHYWNLVNCGDGWYHFDATPRSSKLPAFVSFMFTDQEAADYTVSVGGGREYYTFDGSLYPERATDKPWETAELPAPINQ